MRCSCYAIFSTLAYLMTASAIDDESNDCHKFFKYVKRANVWSGGLTVPIPQFGLPIDIELNLDLLGLLKSKYVGVIELLDAPADVLRRITEDKESNVEYNILFPVPFPLPIVNSIIVNGQTLCKSDKVLDAQVVTKIKLKHEFPSNYKPVTKGLTQHHLNVDESDECGEYVSSEHVFDVPDGESWPWLVAILVKQDEDVLKFHCTGSLLSQNFVLTAAHCVSNGAKYKDSDFVLYFGKHDLSKWGEKDSQVSEVKRFIKHPQFNSSTYSSDLALIQISRPVIYTKYVKPICLWQGKTSLDSVIGRKGFFIGWGKDETTNTIRSKPRVLKLAIVSQEECLRSQIDFHFITSTRSFCAGNKNGEGPCKGDSGSTLIYPNAKKGPNYWHLRGIVSLSLYDRMRHTCDYYHYAVFTDIAKFTPWITAVLKIKN